MVQKRPKEEREEEGGGGKESGFENYTKNNQKNKRQVLKSLNTNEKCTK